MPSHPVIARNLVDAKGYQDLDSPVILTSGEIGIYYLNAENLARDGGEFNKHGNNSSDMIGHACCMARQDRRFGEVIDILAAGIREAIDGSEMQAVSGGQRRDWLFSGPVAERLDLPHISCYKDGGVYRISNEMGTVNDNISGFNAVHVADLLTVGSSCYDARKSPPTGWIPMIRNGGGSISRVFAVVDRLQGGGTNLNAAGVAVNSFVQVDEDFLRTYSAQPDRAVDYIRNPRAWGERYVREQGIEPFVAAFGPKKKDDRGTKFLAVYERALRDSERWDELSGRVRNEYGVDIETLPYRDVKIGEE